MKKLILEKNKIQQTTIHDLLSYQHDDIVIYIKKDDKAEEKITFARLLEDIEYLDQNIPFFNNLLNLYEDRYYFLLALLLGIKRQATHLFPPNLTANTEKYLEANYEQIVVLHDKPSTIKNAVQIDIIDLLRHKSKTKLKQADAIDNNLIQNKLNQFFAQFSAYENCIVIFTSGSTGNPEPFTKNWNDFICVAKQLTPELDKLKHKPYVLATVPPQHMFGLEVSMIMPLVNGLTIHAARPFFPEDISLLTQASLHSTILITTPIHINACVKTNIILHNVELSISATAPLASNLAKKFEQLQQTKVLEIYGCTEVGVIATRITSKSNYWNCLSDIVLEQIKDNKVLLKTSRSINQFILNDLVSDITAKAFLMLGRQQDMINIAGKRNSLSYLNHHLLSCKLISDGCFYQIEEKGRNNSRLIVFIVKSKRVKLTENKRIKNEIKSFLIQYIDPVFLPRHFYFLEQIPKNSMGKVLYNELKNIYQKSS